MPIARPDRDGKHQGQYKRNRRRIFTTQSICALCGKPVDMELQFPHPLSKTIDHIIPIAQGGHPSDISNMQLAHFCCNRAKGDKLMSKSINVKQRASVGNRNLPLSLDWIEFAKH